MLEDILDEIKELKGFKGAVISDYSGEPLVLDKANETIDLLKMTKKLTPLFRDIHLLTEDYSIGELKTMQVTTTDSIIFMACSGEHERVHLHIFSVFDSDANYVLNKRAMESAIGKIITILNIN